MVHSGLWRQAPRNQGFFSVLQFTAQRPEHYPERYPEHYQEQRPEHYLAHYLALRVLLFITSESATAF